MTSLILAASAVVSTGVGATKSKSNSYSKGSNLLITVDTLPAGADLSGFLQTSVDGVNFADTCSIENIASTDITLTRNAFAARYEGAIPQFVRIRWVLTGGATTASAKLVMDD